MSIIVKFNTLKNGSRTYMLLEHNRIPKAKQGKGSAQSKSYTLEKFNSADLEKEGITDIDAYIGQRLSYWRANKAREVTKDSVMIDFSTPLVRDEAREEDGSFEVQDDLLNIGVAVYMKIYHLLGLDELINARRQKYKAEFNLNVILQHLIYSRLLWPESKIATWKDRNRFYSHNDYKIDDVYRAMDMLLPLRDEVLLFLDTKIRKLFGRKGTLIFYDVTNYYMEIDDDDPEGGLRARGYSKEHRTEPIVQMGLFVDEIGLPMTYELFRGNMHDSQTFPEALDSPVLDVKSRKRIVVADGAMMTFKNILKIRQEKNGYVISQSIRKASEDAKAFALDEDGWECHYDENGELLFKIKERYIPRSVESYGYVDGKKHSGRYNERQVFLWSRKYSEKAKADRNRMVQKALDREGVVSGTFKDSNYGSSKYLKKKPKMGADDVECDGYELEFDWAKLDEDEIYDGYYILCSNVVGAAKINNAFPPEYSYYTKEGFFTLNREVPAREIAEMYSGLWKIEETFKVTKTGMLKTRPVFHHKDDRIRTHFFLCYLALVLERILELSAGWSISCKQIQKSLSSMNVVNIGGANTYQNVYYDRVCEALFKAMGIKYDKKYMRQRDLQRFFASVKKVGD